MRFPLVFPGFSNDTPKRSPPPARQIGASGNRPAPQPTANRAARRPWSANRQPEHMPPGTGAAHFAETSGLECGNEAHEPIARRIGINRVCLHDRGAPGPGKLDGRGDGAPGDTSASQPANGKEADDRPDAFAGTVVIDKPTVCRSRRNGTPRHGFPVDVAKQAHGRSGGNALGHGGLAAGSVGSPGLFGGRAPDHAPTGLWPATALEKPLEVRPSALIDFMEHEAVELG
jgi:hypothetical protein